MSLTLCLLLILAAIAFAWFHAAGAALRAAVQRGAWGFPFRRPNCPVCGRPASADWAPICLPESLWGGWNCSRCGCEMDRRGNVVGGRRYEPDPAALDLSKFNHNKRRRPPTEDRYRAAGEGRYRGDSHE